MHAFATAHPAADDIVLFANCEQCGATAPLGLGFSADDAVIDEALTVWCGVHICGDVDHYGLLEFPNEEKTARYFGL